MKLYYPSKSFLNDTSPIIYEYLLYGFKQLTDNIVIDESLNKECRNYVRPNDPNHLTVFYVEIDKKKYRVIYDWSDFHHYKEDCRKKDDFYFKIHFLKEYYNIDRTYPIGQTIGKMEYFLRLNELLEKSYNIEQDLVCIYRTTNYDVRLKAVELLSKSRFKCVLGLKDFNAGNIRPYAPKEFSTSQLIPAWKHMTMQAQSKFILALPAVDNSRAWRHTEAWMLGKPLIALDLQSLCPKGYENCYIQIKDDLSDLIEKLEYYDKHYDQAVEIGKKGKEYFDNFLSPKAMAENIINIILKEND